MKKVLLVRVWGVIGFNANSQVMVNDVNINELDVKYIELVGQRAFGWGKIKVTIDYGQEMKLFKPPVIKSADGTNAKFNSMIGALNFMEANGWELVEVMVFPGRTADEDNEVRYLLRKAGS
ncbi:MAG: hypothetical protein HUJ25_00335 [Crocinitomicaceae bacterium]|nr:hypothetical protein [Crocinitomicaceae bacterium]